MLKCPSDPRPDPILHMSGNEKGNLPKISIGPMSLTQGNDMLKTTVQKAVESERSLFVVKNTQRRQRQINEIHFRSGVVRARMHELLAPLLARSCNPNQRNVPLSPWRRQQSVAPQVAAPTTVKCLPKTIFHWGTSNLLNTGQKKVDVVLRR